MAYFIIDAAGRQIEVCFALLTADDANALNGDDRQGSRFGEAWKVYAEHEAALKLVRCDNGDKSILGIVKIGMARRINGGSGPLRDSLLETAPVYRYDTKERRYRGIGRVLVARLIVESKAQGAEGRLRVRPAQGSAAFYISLGFVPAESGYCVLNAAMAEDLLAVVQAAPK